MKKSTGNLWISILGGAAVFGGLYFGLGVLFRFPVTIALAIGLIVFGTALIKLNKRTKSKTIVFEGTTAGELEETIRGAKKLSQEMRQSTARLSQDEVRSDIMELVNISDAMMELLRKDPKDLRIIKQFITYYLEPTHKIVIKYADLATTRPMPADAFETLDRTEKSFKTIRMTFLQQKEKMLLNDMMDLDTEMKVFESVSGVTLNGKTPANGAPGSVNQSQSGAGQNRSTPM